MVKRYGLLIDLERCIGCQTCTVACKAEHGIEVGSGIRVITVGGAHQDTPSGKYPNLSMYYLPIPCMHCEQPPCRQACPVEAIYQRPDGIVLIDKGKCNGCQECLPACPYQALVADPDGITVHKCNLCYERLDEGFGPFCAMCCPEEAIICGDVSDPASNISRRISHQNAYTLEKDLATGPAVNYCAPMSPQPAA